MMKEFTWDGEGELKYYIRFNEEGNDSMTCDNLEEAIRYAKSKQEKYGYAEVVDVENTYYYSYSELN